MANKNKAMKEYWDKRYLEEPDEIIEYRGFKIAKSPIEVMLDKNSSWKRDYEYIISPKGVDEWLWDYDSHDLSQAKEAIDDYWARKEKKPTLEEAINMIGKKFTLNESIGDDGINNMDLSEIDEKTPENVEIPYAYAKAIQDHKRAITRNKERFKESEKLADEVVKENERESHKVAKTEPLKKMKLSESFFEDWREDYRTKFGDATVYNDEGRITISWYSSSVDSTIEDAERMIKDLQKAVEFAKTLR